MPLAQQTGEQIMVRAAGNAVDVVVGGHEGDRPGVETREHGRQVDLGEIVRADVGGLTVAASDRLPLCGEMLEDDAHALATERVPPFPLHADHDRPGERGGQQRILTEGLLGATPAAIAQHVQRGDEGEVHPARGELSGHGAGGLLEGGGVPGGCGGEVHGERGAAERLVAVRSLLCDQHADAVGTRIGDRSLQRLHGLGALLRQDPAVGPGASGPGIRPHRGIQRAHTLPALDLGERLLGEGEASSGAAQGMPAEEPLVELAHLLVDRHRLQQGVDRILAGHAVTPSESGSEMAE